jgi:S1-C subfamily serine protease
LRSHWQGLRRLGYRVYGVRPQGACARLGLRNGDVVLAVGARPRSKPLARWADVVSLYRLLEGKKPLVVRLQRRARKITLKRAGR